MQPCIVLKGCDGSMLGASQTSVMLDGLKIVDDELVHVTTTL